MTTDPTDPFDDARQAAGGGPADDILGRLLELVGGRAGVEASFGEPVRNGDIVVIPVARSRWAVGGGSGGGATTADDAMTATPGASTASGFGSGGGGGVITNPVGYVEIGPDGAVYRPIARQVGPVTILAAAVGAAIVLRALARLLRAT